MKQFDFYNDSIVINEDLLTTFKKKTLVLKNIKFYNGPITLQYLPFGGIQSVYNNNLIINCKEGFITCDYVIYNNQKMTNEQFIKQNNNLVNIVLPN